MRTPVREAVLPWQRIEVRGPSMVPSLHDGDAVLIRRTARVRPGDIVLGRFRGLPDRLVIKRAQRPTDGGWWLVSENTYAGGDSSVHGVADVLGRAVLRLHPWPPRRIGRAARR